MRAAVLQGIAGDLVEVDDGRGKTKEEMRGGINGVVSRECWTHLRAAGRFRFEGMRLGAQVMASELSSTAWFVLEVRVALMSAHTF